jgi:hypothetical protein
MCEKLRFLFRAAARSDTRLPYRLLAFPLLAAIVSSNWARYPGGARLLLGGDKARVSIFLVFSSLVAGLALTIAVIPPRKLTQRTRPRVAVPPAVMLWYCCALVNLPQLLIGNAVRVVPAWMSGPATLYEFLLAYEVEVPALLFCGVVLICIDICFCKPRRGRASGRYFGFFVWSLCLARAFMLLLWGPLSVDMI